MGGSAREVVLDIVSGFGCRQWTVEESINLQVLHWATPQGKVPLSGDDFLCVGCYELGFLECFLLCRKETNGLLEKMKDVSGSFFRNMKNSS